jgi:hypothetical protein
MYTYSSIFGDIAGLEEPRLSVPANRLQWMIQGVIAAWRGLTGLHLFASGKALTYDQGTMRMAVGHGIVPVMKLLAHRQPVLSLCRVDRGSNPLATFLRRTGLEPADVCDMLISSNGTLVLYGSSAGRPAVVHMPTSKSSHDSVIRHHRGLALARLDLADCDLLRLLPEPLGIEKTRSVQSLAKGTLLDAMALSDRQLMAAITAGLDFSLALHRFGQTRKERAPISPMRPRIDAVLDVVAPQEREFIETARRALDHWTASAPLRSVPMHGDFWVGNLCFSDDLSDVTGVIDWERYESHGTPLRDPIHLILMTLATHRRVSVGSLLPEIWLDNDRHFHMLFTRICSLFDVELAQLQWAGISVWLSLMAHLAVEPRPPRFAALLSDIVSPAGAVIGGWLAAQGARQWP